MEEDEKRMTPRDSDPKEKKTSSKKRTMKASTVREKKTKKATDPFDCPGLETHNQKIIVTTLGSTRPPFLGYYDI